MIPNRPPPRPCPFCGGTGGFAERINLNAARGAALERR